jgi:Putative prokaryotic signal transducing protein
MTEVFTDPDFTVVGFMRSELEGAGIPCFVRNQHTNTSMTGIPTVLFWPILCVTDDRDAPKAKAIVTSFVAARKDKEPDKRSDWICSKCGESVPASFDQCWQCGETKPIEAK